MPLGTERRALATQIQNRENKMRTETFNCFNDFKFFILSRKDISKKKYEETEKIIVDLRQKTPYHPVEKGPNHDVKMFVNALKKLIPYYGDDWTIAIMVSFSGTVFSGYGVSNKACKYLAELILGWKQLTYLDLDDNGIDDDGAKCLADALEKRQYPLKLSLQNNKISDVGRRYLAEAVQKNPIAVSSPNAITFFASKKNTITVWSPNFIATTPLPDDKKNTEERVEKNSDERCCSVM